MSLSEKFIPCLAHITRSGLSAVLITAFAGCGSDDKPKEEEVACVAGTAEGCEGGQVCEEVAGAEPACFAPVAVVGRVFDAADGMGVEDASVVALDINGSARSSVVFTGEDGVYSIVIPITRDADGVPMDDSVTLRVAAAGYQGFPTPPREALPIDLSTAELDAEAEADERLVVRNAATDVALIALPGDTTALGVIEGHIEHELAAGALVIAVQGDRAVSSAIADADGAFVLYNVPAGATTVEAYRAGLNVEPSEVTAQTAGSIEDVVLAADVVDLATVSGSVNIVNAEGGLTTSVILVVESTFIENAARGTAPAGLRADDVSGAFSIAGVPPGSYVVLAAFENDRLVRDPDQSIGGTEIVHLEVSAGQAEVTLPESFKITEALAVNAPGADGLELLPPAGDPTFVWADDSSEDGYEVRVYDAFGELVHEALDVPRVTGASTVSYTWSGSSMETGMVYQFRVLSYRVERKSGARTYISATEDLRGVFQAGTPVQQEGNEP